ncbi:MAG: hypothetical protein WCI52_01245 [bacterium]
MFTLLTTERRKALKQEYKKRFFVIFFSLVSCSIFITAVFLLPSIVISKVKQKEEEVTLSSVTSSGSVSFRGVLLDQSKKVSQEIMVLKTPDLKPSESISEVLKSQDSTIKIKSFQYQYSSVYSTLIIAGVADSRNDLIRFSKLLQADSKFSGAEFPISNLSVENNIDFTIKITGKF